MLDLRNLKAAVLGIMRRAGASKFNGTRGLHSVKCVSAMAMAMPPLTRPQPAHTRSGLRLLQDFQPFSWSLSMHTTKCSFLITMPVHGFDAWM